MESMGFYAQRQERKEKIDWAVVAAIMAGAIFYMGYRVGFTVNEASYKQDVVVEHCVKREAELDMLQKAVSDTVGMKLPVKAVKVGKK